MRIKIMKLSMQHKVSLHYFHIVKHIGKWRVLSKNVGFIFLSILSLTKITWGGESPISNDIARLSCLSEVFNDGTFKVGKNDLTHENLPSDMMEIRNLDI